VGTTNGVLLPYPELTDTADGPDAVNKLANAVEDYFFDRIMPAGVTRWLGYYWGAGTNFPTVVQGLKSGDTYFHTGLGCLMGYDGTNWRQREKTEVPSATARNTINANYSTLMYPGFQVVQSDVGRTYEWSGAVWNPVVNLPGVRLTKAGTTPTGAGGWTILPFDNPGALSNNAAGMWASGNPSHLVAPERGLYRAMVGANNCNNLQLRLNSGGSSSNGTMVAAATNSAALGYLNAVGDAIPMSAGDYVEPFCFTTAAGAVGTAAGYVAYFSLVFAGQLY
jgi:hypothetical protein